MRIWRNGNKGQFCPVYQLMHYLDVSQVKTGPIFQKMRAEEQDIDGEMRTILVPTHTYTYYSYLYTQYLYLWTGRVAVVPSSISNNIFQLVIAKASKYTTTSLSCTLHLTQT